MDDRLYSDDPDERRLAALALGRLGRRSVLRRAQPWPQYSPGAANAWLLMITTKPPAWREPLVVFPEDSPTLGVPAHGFFYPDPQGFWSEVRRWAMVLLRQCHPAWNAATALSVSALFHVGDDAGRLGWARSVMRPRVLLFLDEPSWQAAAIEARTVAHHVPDPHRRRQVYEGFWGTEASGTVIGKAPQHPATHNLYRPEDMDHYLASAPVGARQ